VNPQAAAVCLTANVCPATVIVPVRAPPEFAAIWTATVPVPVPEAPAVIVIHAAFDVAVQGHEAPAVTATLVGPPAAAALNEAGAIAKVHVGGGGGDGGGGGPGGGGAAADPDCTMVNVLLPMAIVACRCAESELAATLTRTWPDPEPLEPLEIVTHGALLLAVHRQPAPVVTDTDTVPPLASMVWLAELSDTAHSAVPSAWSIVIVCPAIVAVPLRSGPMLGETVIFVVPVPLPPPPTVSQSALLTAVHAHPLPAATWTVIVPPAASTDELAGDTAYVHGAGAWSIVIWVSLTASTPWRGERSAFAPTRKSMVPLPCPLAADVSAIHDAVLDALHVQSRVVEIVTVPEAPLAGTDDSELAAVTWHFAVVGAATLIEEDPHAAHNAERRKTDVSRMASRYGRASMRRAMDASGLPQRGANAQRYARGSRGRSDSVDHRGMGGTVGDHLRV
jgi:hypothetical protein